jgi:hypothetical protein
VRWLENGPCLHEGVNHLVDVPIEHPRQVYANLIYNKHIPKFFVVSRPNCVVPNLLVHNV